MRLQLGLALLVPHPASWLAVIQVFSPLTVHLSADGIVGQFCFPDTIYLNCYMTDRI